MISYLYKLMEYCYIFDYSVAKIFELKLSEEEMGMDTEDILDKYNFKSSEVYVMYSNNKIDIESLNE